MYFFIQPQCSLRWVSPENFMLFCFKLTWYPELLLSVNSIKVGMLIGISLYDNDNSNSMNRRSKKNGISRRAYDFGILLLNLNFCMGCVSVCVISVPHFTNDIAGKYQSQHFISFSRHTRTFFFLFKKKIKQWTVRCSVFFVCCSRSKTNKIKQNPHYNINKQ